MLGDGIPRLHVDRVRCGRHVFLNDLDVHDLDTVPVGPALLGFQNILSPFFPLKGYSGPLVAAREEF